MASETVFYNNKNFVGIGSMSATTLSGAGSGITALNMANASSGTLAVARGGTGVTASTGTGSVVLSAGPSFTGTVGFQGPLDIYSDQTTARIARIYNTRNSGGSQDTCFIHTDQPFSTAATAWTGSALTVTTYPQNNATNNGYIAKFGTSDGDGADMDPKVVISSAFNKVGFVGIGTTNPTTTLEVVGSLRSSGAVVFSQSTTAPTCVIGASSGGNNGQTGILQVVGIASSYLAIGTSMNSTAGQTHIQFNNPNGVVGSITTNGTATAYNTGSDYRLKSNIVHMSDGLEVINKLDPVYFTFNNDPSEVCSGFIAHVLQEVIPNAVNGEKDAVNDDGSIKPQGVDSSFIVSFLVSAVQELSTKNTDLETKLQTAQNDIDLLESRLAAIEALISTNTSADATTTSTGTRSDALLAEAGAV